MEIGPNWEAIESLRFDSIERTENFSDNPAIPEQITTNTHRSEPNASTDTTEIPEQPTTNIRPSEPRASTSTSDDCEAAVHIAHPNDPAVSTSATSSAHPRNFWYDKLAMRNYR